MKKQIQNAEISQFEKNELNELATIQGGLAGDSSTSGYTTSSAADDCDYGTNDSDCRKEEEVPADGGVIA